MTNNPSKYNIGSVIATEDHEGAGLVTVWSLSGAANIDRLKAAAVAAGLPEVKIPSPPSAQVALTRAVATQGGKGVLVATLDDGSKLVSDVAHDTEGLPVLRHRLQVTLTAAGVLEFKRHDGAEGVKADQAEVDGAFTAARTQLSTDDVSAWLMSLLEECDALAIRPRGGVYYVPPTRTATWRAWRGVILGATSHWIGEIPAMRSDAAVETIIRSLEVEALSAAAEIQRELEKVAASQDGALGARGLGTRMATVQRLNAKLDRYFQIFGQPAEAAANAVMRLKQNIFTCIQFAEGKAEGRDMDAPRLLDLCEVESKPLTDDEVKALADEDAVGRFAKLDLVEAPAAAVEAPAAAVEAPAAALWTADSMIGKATEKYGSAAEAFFRYFAWFMGYVAKADEAQRAAAARAERPLELN